MDRYFVNCDKGNYDKTNSILIEKNIEIVTMMDNRDDTFDYIIKCNETMAEQLEDLGVVLVRDKIIKFDLGAFGK